MTKLEQLKQKLNYARNFTPHKVAYYELLIKQAGNKMNKESFKVKI